MEIKSIDMKSLKFAAMLLLSSVTLCACSDDPSISTEEENTTPEYNELSKINLSRNEALVATAGQGFAFNLLREAVRHEVLGGQEVGGIPVDDYVLDKNVAVSPFSMSSVLAMYANGAVGETRDSILKGLGFEGMDIADVNSYFNKMFTAFPTHDTSAEIQVANAFSYHLADVAPDAIKQEFTSVLTNNFGADILPIPLYTDMAEVMNAWVAEKTKNRIPQLISIPGAPINMLAITNAFYFDGAWTSAFDSKATTEGVFTNLDGSESEVEFMNKEYSTAVFYDDNSYCVNMSFGNRAYWISFILPEEGLDITEYIASFSAEKYASLLAQSALTNLKLSLPKFDVEFKTDYIGVIKDCGFGKACRVGADYSGIIEGLGSEAMAYLLQGCTLSIDEQGAKAASATQGGGMPTSPGPITENMEISFNRPFMYVLKETTTNTILMTGVITKL